MDAMQNGPSARYQFSPLAGTGWPSDRIIFRSHSHPPSESTAPNSRPERARRFGVPKFYIVGGGPMALCSAIQVLDLAKALGFECEVVLIADDPRGHHPMTSWRCSQGWLHFDGVIYALTQSSMLPHLQTSSRQLLELAARAFGPEIGHAMAGPGVADEAEEIFASCGIWNRRLSGQQVKNRLRGISLPADTCVFATRDRAMDLGVLMGLLGKQCQDRGVLRLDAEVANLEARGSWISAVQLANGRKIEMEQSDQVLVCAGPRSRKLLDNSLGVSSPSDLRLFQSTLVSVPTLWPLLAAYIGGGPTIVPMKSAGETRAVLGNSQRVELFSDQVDPTLIPTQAEQILADVREFFGLAPQIEEARCWPGIKAEFVPRSQTHSQSHGVRSLEGIQNGWIGLPGKLSQSVSAAGDLAAAVLMRAIGAEAPGRSPVMLDHSMDLAFSVA